MTTNPKDLKIIAMIPARLEASRFPGKLMEDLHGKPVITRTYEAARDTGLFEQVVIVTDSELVKTEIEKAGGKVMMSKKQHESGSDRIAEAVEDLEVDIVVNVQGDEPMIDSESLQKLISVFKGKDASDIDLASLMSPLSDREEIENPNNVKVITDTRGYALYFSRAAIPFQRDLSVATKWYKHIGIYAFRKHALMSFSKLSMQVLEASEKIEALRYLEYGRTIKMVETTVKGVGIDTPEDLHKARALWKQS